MANDAALGQDSAHIATLAEGYAFERDGVTALTNAGPNFAFEE